MKERPILFSAPMVRALLEGRKTVTRRVMNLQPDDDASVTVEAYDVSVTNQQGYQEAGAEIFGAWWRDGEIGCKCPYGGPGDRLWVRETWYCDHFEVQKGPYLQPADMHDLDQSREDGELVYAADGVAPYEQEQPTWKPSIHMPRWASRILLEIIDVRIERLQDITYEDAVAEGVYRDCSRAWTATEEGGPCHKYPEPAFRDLWISTGGDWDANPWVWVVEFRRVTP